MRYMGMRYRERGRTPQARKRYNVTAGDRSVNQQAMALPYAEGCSMDRRYGRCVSV